MKRVSVVFRNLLSVLVLFVGLFFRASFPSNISDLQASQLSQLLDQLKQQVEATIASEQGNPQDALKLISWLSDNQANLPLGIVEWFLAHDHTIMQSAVVVLSGIAPHFSWFILEGGSVAEWAIDLLLERLEKRLEQHVQAGNVGY